MKKSCLFAMGLAIMVAGLTAIATAEVPQVVNYQGRLTDGSGDPVPDDDYEITFMIYTGLPPLAAWTSGSQTVPVSNGLFSYQLGSAVALPDDIFAETLCWLGIKVGEDSEISPQTKLTSVAYAYHSLRADHAWSIADDSVTSPKIQDGSILFVDIGDNGAAEGQVMKWDGTSWVAANDETAGTGWNWQDSSSYGPDSVSYAAFADSAGTVNAGDIHTGTLSDARLSSNVSKLGNSIETGEITNGTILFQDIAQNGAANGQVMKWNGSAWIASDDETGSGSNWTVTDSVLYTNNYWGIARGGAGNTLYSDSANTHVNLGVACTTGVSGNDNRHITISGGVRNTAQGEYSTIAGGNYNATQGYESTISGGSGNTAGGRHSTVSGGTNNTAIGNDATVSGGRVNTATGEEATVGGGSDNTASGQRSTVGGGWMNTAGGAAVIGGGIHNTASGISSTVSGGTNNDASGDYATVGGGWENTAVDNRCTVSGGSNNTAEGGFTTIGGGSRNVASGSNSTVGGGRYNTASGQYSTVSGGTYNSASGQYSTVSGGVNSTASGSSSIVGGGQQNSVGGDYSSILGGVRDTIFAGADFSYLFGINSKLTEDSTFMVDMPHIRFGNETTGYEVPSSDGTAGQVMATDGSGQLSWSDPAGESNWTLAGNVLYTNGEWGIARAGNVLNGIYNSNHVNLGVACTTGMSGNNLGYCAVGGGRVNTAAGNYSTVSGGRANTAGRTDGGGHYSTVGGGNQNVVEGLYSAVLGGLQNVVEGNYSAVLGGFRDTITASADYSYLFGINSKLTEDSTFMVDMPHIRFGDEATGYEIPTEDGAVGQVMATNGSGQLSWADVSDGGGWTDDGDVVRLETSTDSVGIGTSTPTARLDVAGNIHASGTISSGSSITVDGTANTITSTSGSIGFVDENLSTTGTVEMGGFKMTDGAQVDYVLKSDANGVGTWQEASSCVAFLENSTVVSEDLTPPDGDVLLKSITIPANTLGRYFSVGCALHIENHSGSCCETIIKAGYDTVDRTQWCNNPNPGGLRLYEAIALKGAAPDFRISANHFNAVPYGLLNDETSGFRLDTSQDVTISLYGRNVGSGVFTFNVYEFYVKFASQ